MGPTRSAGLRRSGDSVAFAQSCRIVKCRHERPGSCGFRSLMTQADARACHPSSLIPAALAHLTPTDHRQLQDAEAPHLLAYPRDLAIAELGVLGGRLGTARRLPRLRLRRCDPAQRVRLARFALTEVLAIASTVTVRHLRACSSRTLRVTWRTCCRPKRHGSLAQPGHRHAQPGRAGQRRRRATPPRPRPTPTPGHPRNQIRSWSQWMVASPPH
jgi:hypothetical protein